MTKNTYNRFARLLGELAGGACRRLLQGERRAAARLIEWGVPGGFVKAMAWGILFLALGALLYVVSWLVIVVLVVAGTGWMRGSSDEQAEWPIGDQAEHKKSLFYDPIDYDDDPDPRFNDF